MDKGRRTWTRMEWSGGVDKETMKKMGEKPEKEINESKKKKMAIELESFIH